MNSSFENDLSKSHESERGEFGNDVVFDIDLARHGQKSDFNSPRIKNVDETEKIAVSSDIDDYDLVAIRSTPVERAVHTGLVMKSGFEQNEGLGQDKVNVRVRDLPTGILSTGDLSIEKIMEETDQAKDMNLISPKIRELYKQAVQSEQGSTWEKESAGVELFIKLMETNIQSLQHVFEELEKGEDLSSEALDEIEAFKNSQGDEGGMSMLEVVLRMTKHFHKYVKATNKFKNGAKVFIHEVNHAGFIEPFLIYLLDKKGAGDLTEVKKAFEPNESVRISIKRKEKDGEVSMSFKLRGEEYSLNFDEIQDKFSQSEKLLDLIKSHE